METLDDLLIYKTNTAPATAHPFPEAHGVRDGADGRGEITELYEHIYGGPVSVPAGRIVGSFSSGQARFPCRVLEGLRGSLEKLILGTQSLTGLLHTHSHPSLLPHALSLLFNPNLPE